MAKYKRRPDGRYETKVTTGRYNDNGKMIRVTCYGRTIKELEDKIAEVKNAVNTNQFSFHEDSLFKDYAKQWLEVSKANRGLKTKEMYNSILKNHCELLNDIRMKQLTPSDIQRQINACSDHPRTAQQLKVTLRQVVKAAMMDGLLFKDITASAELPRRVVRERRALTKAEQKAVREADFNEMEKAFIYVLYCCGVRPAEMYALTWNDINFMAQEITINKALTFDTSGTAHVSFPKTNNGIRVIQTHRMAIEALKEFRRTSNHLNVFCTEDGQHMSKHQYNMIWERCKRKIETALGHPTELTMYYFRHNFCTELYYSGISMKEAQRLMGHADASMIMRVYSHLDSDKEDTKNKLNAINF